jgi:thiamine biosynthesis lipoprotein
VIRVERFDAMGTWIEVRSRSHSDHRRVRELFSVVEGAASRFRPESELSQLNRSDAPTIELSPLLTELFEAASTLRDRTGGLVDPAVGADVVAWGYDRTFEALEDGCGAPHTARAGGRWSVNGTTLNRDPGTRFDFGGIAKGWAADRAVDVTEATVVSAGGDLHSRDTATTVEVVDPWGETAVRLALGRGGLATSSSSRRRWISAGGPAHHLIDPRTGDPTVSPVVSATVVAATALEAEAGAKAVLILGARGLAWAAERSWIRSAVAIWNDGNVFATPGIEVAA